MKPMASMRKIFLGTRAAVIRASIAVLRSLHRQGTFGLLAALLRELAGIGERLLPAREALGEFGGEAARNLLERFFPVHEFESAALQAAFFGELRDVGGG